MDSDLIPFLPQGLTLELFSSFPEVAQTSILIQAQQAHDAAFDENNEYAGILQMFEEAEREAENFTQFYTGIENAHDYDDLERLFERYPSARFVVRMYSGQIATVSPGSFQRLLQDHYGDYNDQEDVNSNFEILSILRHSFEDDRLIEQRIATAMGETQPDLGGIDDVRFSIREKYVPGDYHCPTNLNCVGKCILKFLEIIDCDLSKFPELQLINFDTVTTIPEMNALLKKHKSQVRIVSYTTKNEHYRDFLRVPIYKYELPGYPGYFHAILILDVKKYRNLWDSKRKLPDVDVQCSITEFEDLDQSALDIMKAGERQKKFKAPRTPPKNRMFASFDFETRRDDDNSLTFAPILSPASATRIYKQVPAMLTWAWSAKHADYALDLDNPSKVVNGKFMSWLKQNLVLLDQRAAKDDKSTREIVLFTFNGAVFDNHLFLGYLDHPEWKVCPRGYLGDEVHIKRFSIKNTALKFKNKVTFLDLRMFFPPNVSLKKACEMYGGSQKHDFDIVAHMTKRSILANLDQYIEYGLQDSRALYDLAMKHRKGLAEASEKPELDMFSCVSIADYANRVRDLYHPEEVEIWYNKRDEVAEFERNCVMGGMLIVQELKCDDPVIPVDYNALYGSSMALYKHPTGKREFFNRKNHPDKMAHVKKKLNAKYNAKQLFLAKVRFRVNPKCTIPILRIKDEGSRLRSALGPQGPDPDPKGLVKTGYFSNIDLQRAVKHGGYIIEEVLFVVEFESKAEIFKEFIDMFALKRAKHKTAMISLEKGSDEYNRHNVLQELCKLIPNSSYGSLLLKPFVNLYTSMYISTFMRNSDPTLEVIGKCGRNQILVKFRNRCKHNNTRPISQGVFILSYSKIIFDKALVALDAFRTIGIVLYGDTDSVYIRKSALPILEQAGIIGDALGQAKNDYGDRTVEKFRCLGKKMKVCLLDNGEIKTTIKGFKGLNNLSHEQKQDLFDTFDYVIETQNTDTFMSKTYDTMQRSGFHIKSTVATRSFRMTAHEQYQVVDTKCYPLYFDISSIPE
jgi:hypothetical protein